MVEGGEAYVLEMVRLGLRSAPYKQTATFLLKIPSFWAQSQSFYWFSTAISGRTLQKERGRVEEMEERREVAY